MGEGYKIQTKNHPSKEFCESLAGWPSCEVTCEIQPGKRLFRFQHVLLTWPFTDYSLAS